LIQVRLLLDTTLKRTQRSINSTLGGDEWRI
jgi:hypothetical protein